MQRMPPLDYADMDADQQRVVDTIVAGPRKGFYGLTLDLADNAPDRAANAELLRERIKLQRILGQHSQAIDALAEVDRIPAQIDHRQVIRRSHHASEATVRNTVSRLRAFTSPPNPTMDPLGNWICHWVPAAVASTMAAF